MAHMLLLTGGEVNEIRQIFDSFDTKHVGSLKPNEATIEGQGRQGQRVQSTPSPE